MTAENLMICESVLEEFQRRYPTIGRREILHTIAAAGPRRVVVELALEAAILRRAYLKDSLLAL